jgi:hypothetical protein
MASQALAKDSRSGAGTSTQSTGKWASLKAVLALGGDYPGDGEGWSGYRPGRQGPTV